MSLNHKFYCTQEDHKENQLNLICTNKYCPQKGLMCSFCLLKNHNEHVNDCIPFKELKKALNNAITPQQQEKLTIIGNKIRKEHDQIIFNFRQNLKKLKDNIKNLEETIESQMELLKQEAQFFVSNQLEKSIEIIHEEAKSISTINQELFKIFPLLKVHDQKAEVFSDQEKQLEADRIMKMAEVLQREVKYNMEKSVENLALVKQSISRASTKKLTSHISENRFGMVLQGWCLNKIDSITFQSTSQNEKWLKAIGLYEITSPNLEDITVNVKLYEGQDFSGKLIYQQEIKCSDDTLDYQGSHHYAKINLISAIKLNPHKMYTICMKPSQECVSYFGVNGAYDTKDFIFYNTQFEDKQQNNSTNTNTGMFPVFYYEQ